MQLEKEQEAVVNRLTRELSLLRQQTASVASNTSSVSTGLPDSVDHLPAHQQSGAQFPAQSRQHRSSSSLSNRSATTSTTIATGNAVGTASGIAGSTVSGIAPARETTAPYAYARDPLSRQSSVASRRSEASSPSLSSSLYQSDHFPNTYGHRHTGSASQSQHPGSARSSYVPATPRYEEATHHRTELEMVKRENEALRRRVQELERSLVSQREPAATDLSRQNSVSTNASVPPHLPLARDDDDVVNVGESARSSGVDSRH